MPWKLRPILDSMYPDKKIDTELKTKQKTIIFESLKGFCSTFLTEKPYILSKLIKTIVFAK